LLALPRCSNVIEDNGKEKDPETGFLYYGARYHWPEVWSGWLSPDPMMDVYPGISPYNYCNWNPVIFVDPDGRDWKDIYGNIISDHSNIKVYIFYDPCFKKQSEKMYEVAERKYGKGSVALSDATTRSDFAQDWHDMAGSDIQEVNLNYHGSNQALHLDANKKEYITSTGNGKTNRSGTSATNVQDLPSISGNISNATLNINSCHSNEHNKKLKGSKLTLMGAFYQKFSFKTIRGTADAVRYRWITRTPEPGRLLLSGAWDYLGVNPAKRSNNTPVIPLYYQTGGMK